MRATLGADVDTRDCLSPRRGHACFKSHHSDMQSTAQKSHCVNTICGHHKKNGVKEGASSTCDLQFAVSRELTFHDSVSPRNPSAIQKLIPRRTTKVKLIKIPAGKTTSPRHFAVAAGIRLQARIAADHTSETRNTGGLSGNVSCSPSPHRNSSICW